MSGTMDAGIEHTNQPLGAEDGGEQGSHTTMSRGTGRVEHNNKAHLGEFLGSVSNNSPKKRTTWQDMCRNGGSYGATWWGAGRHGARDVAKCSMS